MRNIYNFLTWILLIFGLSRCLVQDAVPAKNQFVTIYTDSYVPADSVIFKKFEKENNIRVYLKVVEIDSLLTLLKDERYNSNADLILISQPNNLLKAHFSKLFQRVDSEKLKKNIPINYRSTENTWFSLCKTPLVIAYRKDVLSRDTIQFYADLIHPEWKGKLALQGKGGNSLRTFEASIRTYYGEKADSVLYKIYSQRSLPLTGDDHIQLKRINSGESQLAVVELSKLLEFKQQKDSISKVNNSKLSAFFPNQKQKGVFYSVTGAGVYRFSRNTNNAILLLEFLSSKSAQYNFSENRYSYPIHSEVNASFPLSQFGIFRGRFLLKR